MATVSKHRYPVDDDAIRLPSLGCELPLGEIYDKVEFNP